MSFFGMGAWELMIIAVAALVIFGPGKLPEVAGQAGRAVRDFRRMTSELSGEFEKTIADVTDTKGSLGHELKGMANQVNSVTKSVQKDLNKATGAGSKTAAKSTAAKSTASGASKTTTTAATRTGSTTTTAAKSTTAAAKAAVPVPVVPKTPSKADPLADMMFSDDDVAPKPSSARPAPTAARPSTPPASPRSSGTTTAASDPAIDAVARARQRRLAAGYNSHRTP